MYFYERHTNRSARSDFLHLDAQSCLMSALVAAGLLVSFAFAKVGRGQFIESHIVVPPDHPIGTVAVLDAIREEIGTALGATSTAEKWLKIDFTSHEQWT